MHQEDNIADDLLKEGSLWRVYLLSWRLPFPWASFLPSALLSCVFFWFSMSAQIDVATVISYARQVVDLGITVVSTMLGFLIAGFTVFATLTNPKLFVKMATLKHTDGVTSWLKMTFAIFMHAFAHYAWFLLAAVVVKLMSLPGGPISYVLPLLAGDAAQAKRCVAALAFSVFSGWLLYVVILVQGFIFNIYHACMLSISTTGEKLID